MADFIPGQTRCALCGQPIAADPQMLPDFLPAAHELARFADAAVHESCYAAWDQRPRFEMLYAKLQEVWALPLNPTRTLPETQLQIAQRLQEFTQFAMEH